MRPRPTTICLLVLLAATAAPAAEVPSAHPLDAAAAELARLVPIVERICGAGFRHPPRVQELDGAAAGKVFEEDLRTEVERRYPDATPAQRAALVEAAGTASIRSCVARYSATLRSIVLVRFGFDGQAEALGLSGEGARHLLVTALAHECVHALDDERFHLAKRRAGAADREASRALAMVIEGRAVRFGRAVAAEAGVPEKIREIVPGGEEPEGEHEVFLNLTYRLGARFVDALVERGGVELADRALAAPPGLTHFVCQPDRWPDGEVDPRPGEVLAAAWPDAECAPLSELELRARYTVLDGEEAAERLFAGYRGGARALVLDTNAAVLAFATEEDAERFLVRSRRDVPAVRAGTLVVRAAGARPQEVVDRLAAMLP